MLKLSFLARKGPVNVLRRNEILGILLTQFPPADILERATCEQLASALERIEGLKAEGAEWQRLVERAQNLGDRLRDVKQHRATQPTDDDLANLTDVQLIERLESLLEFARETKKHGELVERRQAEDTARWQQRAASPPSEGRDDTQPAAPAAELAPEPRVTQTDEDAAAIRRQLGWDEGVWNERTGYRYRE